MVATVEPTITFELYLATSSSLKTTLLIGKFCIDYFKAELVDCSDLIRG